MKAFFLLSLFLSFSAVAATPELPLGKFRFTGFQPEFSLRVQIVHVVNEEARAELKRLAQAEGYACQWVDGRTARCSLLRPLEQVRPEDKADLERAYENFSVEFGAPASVVQVKDLEFYKEWEVRASVAKGEERYADYLLRESRSGNELDSRVWFGPRSHEGASPKYAYQWDARAKTFAFDHEIRVPSPKGFTFYHYTIELK